ncbi:MAG: MFS transporter, partial [Candidatus Omnitrophica bacterium]|nr:MFS transporter [Candidatus Omnitrophota bacterium]
MSAKRIVKIASWSLYDLAVKFFTLNIVSLHFVRWLTIKRGMPDIYYSLAFGASMLVVVLFSPVIGKISDISGRKKLILTVFTLTTACLIGLLGFTYNLGVALVLFAFANLFLQLAVIIYNSLITAVAPVKKMGFVSGFGKMFGFIGAIGILYLMKPIVINYGYHPLFFVSG